MWRQGTNMKHCKAKLFPFLLFLIGLPLAFFLSLTVGVMETPDSYLYYILAGYLRFGHIGWVAPFNWNKPQTLFGPVYGLFGSFVTDPGFFQLVLLLLGSLLIYVILKKLLNTRWAVIGALIFLLLPFNIIYSMMIMSEILTGFWMVLFITVLYFVLKKPTWWANASMLVLISSIMTLTRYAYGLLFILSIILCFIFVPKKWFEYLFLTAGIGLLIWWVLFNHQTNGVWSLSVVSGRHLYNNVVYDAKLLPPDNLPIVQTFYKYFPTPQAFIEPWWVNQNFFAVDKSLPEWKIDSYYAQLSFAAIRYHPIAYLWHTVTNVVILPTQVPYYEQKLVTSYASCDPHECLVPWIPIICQPRIRFCPAQTGWAKFITVSSRAQPVIGWICFLLAIIGAVHAFVRGTKYLKVLAIIFLGMCISQAGLEIKEGRFLIPLYPLYAIFIAFTLYTAFSVYKKSMV